MSEEWSCDSEGYINLHEDIETALREYGAENLGETVTVYRYKPSKPTRRDCGSPLEYLLERLDEEYLPDYCDPDKPTQEMLDAEAVFLDAVLAEYKRYSLSVVERVTVNAADYLGSTEQ